MRLIDVKTLQLREFHHKIPTYAILSHTWGREEVTFQEYLHATEQSSSSNTSVIRRKAGFTKILGACSRARADGLEYLWCDTNCIDKTSSAELSEAINSMYAWYRDSTVCYAYLADVGSSDRPGMVMEEVRMSRWFTRGWTLQELLAPRQVLFFNSNWVFIAERQQLADIICRATKIHVGALRDRDTISGYSVAQRMSWAAGRHTSRQEDVAYCLLGIFGINMPLLYGESWKAFIRLQEEIIKISDDQSIFAWDFLDNQQRPYIGLLAPSPDEFASCGSIVREELFTQLPYSTTNIGVSLQLLVVETHVQGTVMVELNCSVELRAYGSRRDAQLSDHAGWRFPVWIWLRLIDGKVYTRSPNPVSRISFLDSYTDWFDGPPTDLFGITNDSSSDCWVSSLYHPIHNKSAESTGFHVTIGFGRIHPEFSTFDHAFLPGDFTIYQVPPKGSPSLSHEIISAGRYTVLLSIVWDHQHQEPRYWNHLLLMGLSKSTVSEMHVNDWNVLLETPKSLNYDTTSDAERVRYIQDRVRKLCRLPMTSSEENAMPSVRMEKRLWEDHHGHPKVIVHLTFQEETRPKPTH